MQEARPKITYSRRPSPGADNAAKASAMEDLRKSMVLRERQILRDISNLSIQKPRPLFLPALPLPLPPPPPQLPLRQSKSKISRPRVPPSLAAPRATPLYLRSEIESGLMMDPELDVKPRASGRDTAAFPLPTSAFSDVLVYEDVEEGTDQGGGRGVLGGERAGNVESAGDLWSPSKISMQAGIAVPPRRPAALSREPPEPRPPPPIDFVVEAEDLDRVWVRTHRMLPPSSSLPDHLEIASREAFWMGRKQ